MVKEGFTGRFWWYVAAMTGGRHLKPVDAAKAETHGNSLEHEAVETADADTLDLTEQVEDEWIEPAEIRPNYWLPALAIATIVGWTAFFGWANRTELLSGPAPQQWVDWIAAWAIPVLLVVCLWLLALRNSRREASRYGEAARALAFESAQLEERLTATNRELSLAREFLHAQSLELESLGRVAVDRVGSSADRLQALIHDNSRQVDAIASVSTTALENMERLRSELPVVANSARDSANQIGKVGQTAHGQLEELVQGFHRLNEFGSASERQVESLKERVEAALAGFSAQTDQLGEIANRRFDLLRGQSEKFRAELEGFEVEAEAAIRRRADALNGELAASRETLDDQELEAIGSLRTRIGALRDEGATIGAALREGETQALDNWRGAIERLRAALDGVVTDIEAAEQRGADATSARLAAFADETERSDAALAERAAAFDNDLVARREAHEAHIARVEETGQALAERLDEVEARLAAASANGAEHGAAIADQSAAIAERLAEARAQMDGTGVAVAELTDASVRLLELIHASAKHSRDDLPMALGNAEQRLSALGDQVREAALLLDQSRQSGEDLSNYLIASREQAEAVAADIEAVEARMADTGRKRSAQLAGWREELDAIERRSVEVAAAGQDEIGKVVGDLEAAIERTVARLNEGGSQAVSGYADAIGERSSAAIGAAISAHSAAAIADLEAAAERAGETSRQITVSLRDQLAKVNELTSHLEHRVADARAQAEERTDNDFARRVALITESLNSNAIDISKALSNEVTDTAWASYLKGDRGIFTRRAVRLLDKDESRAIQEIYDEDQDFREHVARYIHDFEAMLRTLLSTRDGNALAVTLLSSDMGKLYVALAQAIDRLRD